jgi:mono/diheme cytochrome c family protein
MKPSWWRTGPPIKHQQPIPRLSSRQWLRQLAVVFLSLLVWGGIFFLFLGATGATGTPAPADVTASLATTADTSTTPVSFQHDVLPIFERICVKCHGGERTAKSLVLKSYDDLMQGSEDGFVVEPGDPTHSLLIDKIVTGKMPKTGPKLLPKQIRAIIEWVQAGAPNN